MRSTHQSAQEGPLDNHKRATFSDHQSSSPERQETPYAVPPEKSQQSLFVPCRPHPGRTSGIKLNAGLRRQGYYWWQAHNEDSRGVGDRAPYTSDEEDNYPIPGGQSV